MDECINKNVFLWNLNANTIRRNLKYPFCNERILIFFDSLDSGHQTVIDVTIHALITFLVTSAIGSFKKNEYLKIFVSLETYVSLKVYEWLQTGNI